MARERGAICEEMGDLKMNIGEAMHRDCVYYSGNKEGTFGQCRLAIDKANKIALNAGAFLAVLHVFVAAEGLACMDFSITETLETDIGNAAKCE